MVEILIYLMLTVRHSCRILELHSQKRIWGSINYPFLFIINNFWFNIRLVWTETAIGNLSNAELLLVYLFSFSWRFQVVIPSNFRNKGQDIFYVRNLGSNSKLRIWSHLLKKSLMQNFISCAVSVLSRLSLITIILLLINMIITFRCNQNQRNLSHMLMREINRILF